jgi:hypothetical protein
MKTKIISMSLFLAVVFVFGFANIENANAQSVTYPEGCSSALGYSVTTGRTCNGKSTPINAPMPGCTTALGYSVTTGEPCSGSSEALQYLAGCTSLYGYSTFTGRPCNGTSVAVPIPGTTPGLPRTGNSGNSFANVLLLLTSGLVAVLGGVYLSKQSKTV